jgi:monovalent cation:H+ antiporter-2, CPA2 family
MHEIPLITTIALALSAALLFGLIARRLGLSPIVGYLIAGVLIGPYTPGVVGHAKIAADAITWDASQKKNARAGTPRH